VGKESTHTTYIVELYIATGSHKVQKRFSDWLKVHEKIAHKAPGLTPPSKQLVYTLFSSVNVEQRAQDIKTWLQKLVGTYDVFNPTSGLSDLLELGPWMKKEVEALATGQRQAEADRVAEIQRVISQDFQHSQTFHQTWPVCQQTGAHHPILRYPKNTSWSMQHRMWSSAGSYGSRSDATIQGPGGHIVYTLRRLDRSFFGFENAQFGIFNTNGEPLIFLSEQFEFFREGGRFSIFRQNGQSLYKICEVRIIHYLTLASYCK